MSVEGHVGRAPRAPGGATLIYDDACGFCRRWVLRARRLESAGRVRLMPLQDANAPALSGQPRDRLMQAVHLVRSDGEVFAGAAAVRELAPYLKGGWALRLLFRLPGGMWLGARVYAWIARRWGPVR